MRTWEHWTCGNITWKIECVCARACVCACLCGTPQEQTPSGAGMPPPEQTPPSGSRHPSRRLLLRTVRILLECILVSKISGGGRDLSMYGTLSFYEFRFSGEDTMKKNLLSFMKIPFIEILFMYCTTQFKIEINRKVHQIQNNTVTTCTK